MSLFGKTKAYDNGIDYFTTVGKSKAVISARRQENGEITVKVSEQAKSWKTVFAWIYRHIVSILVVAGLFAEFMLKAWVARGAILMLMCTVSWVAILIYIGFKSKNRKSCPKYRYKAAGNMAIDFRDTYQRYPKSIDDLCGREMVSYMSADTTIVAKLWFITICVLAYIVSVNWLWLWAMLFVAATLVILLWSKGVWDVIQKLRLEEPTDAELEVALKGIQAMADLHSRDSF